MKFAIAKEHYDRFHKEGFVEFEGLITPEQLQLLQDEINSVLKKKMSLSDRGLLTHEAQNIYLQGRNLWQQSEVVKKNLLHKRLASIAAELTDSTCVRFGYDQLIPSGYAPSSLLSLQESCCLQGILCSALICLAAEEIGADDDAPPSLFSQTAGNIVFFKADLPIDYTPIVQKNGSRYLMVVYAQKKAVYIHNDNDPNQHFFKTLGYVFGDRLNDILNPIILRNY